MKKKASQSADEAGPDSDIELVGVQSRPRKEPEPFNFEFGDLGEEDEIEEVAPPKKGKDKGKTTATSSAGPAKRPRGRPKKQKPLSPEPDDVRGAEAPDSPDQKKGKRKANGADDGSLDDPPPKKRGKKVVDSNSDDAPLSKPAGKKRDAPKPPPSKAKGKSRAASPVQNGDNDSAKAAVVQKKKKRKINIFASSDAPATFDFKGFSQVNFMTYWLYDND